MIKFIGTAQRSTEIILYYLQTEDNNLFFKATTSDDGFRFSEKSAYVFALDHLRKEEQEYQWSSVRIARAQYEYYLTYKDASQKGDHLFGAISEDLTVWDKVGKVDGLNQTATLIPKYQYNEKYILYSGEKEVRIARSEDLRTWKEDTEIVLSSRKGFFDEGDLEVANAYEAHGNILLLYYVKKEHGGKTHYSVGAAYFDKKDPSKLLWRSDEPIYELPEEFYRDSITPIGCALIHGQLILYWVVNDSTLFSVACPVPVITHLPKKKIYTNLVSKYRKNPIIAPRPHVPWDSRATFNSAAIYEGGKVHFLYRALGDTDLSVLGYATSTDGINIDFRSDEPAYIPREPFETPGNHAFSTLAQHFVSGGGYGGVEDPRITRVGNRIYLTYVAFDGANPPRAAISSIGVEDFLKNKWERWDKPRLISAPGMVNKSAVVFPRRVNGKYVVMHRVYPNILLDYLDNLEFNDFLQGHHFIPPRKKFWDSKKVGAGAPPIETKDGWLLVYQSVGYQDPSKYKIGAMLLDRDNPSKVLYRTHMPLIEPVEPYENDGFKAGVVYPCGAVILDKKLHIYYGGADSYLNVATVHVEELLDAMKHHQEPKVHMIQSSHLS